MAKALRLPFEEFRIRVEEIFERIVRNDEVVVVQTNPDVVVTLRAGEPAEEEHPPRREKSIEAYEAFLGTAGSWIDFDADAFMSDVYASRDHDDRPVVDV